MSQGSVDFSSLSLPETFFCQTRQKECRVVTPHKRLITPFGEKKVPALGVASKKTPLSVTHRSFGTTKLHSSRLDWCVFEQQQG